MRTIKLLTLLFLISFLGYAQTEEEQTTALIKKGIALHNEGDYSGAITEYKKALEIDTENWAAYYEMAYSYFLNKEYENAIEAINLVLKNSDSESLIGQAYDIKGNALDLLGKPDEAIKTYQKGIKKMPTNHMLYYNLALTHYKQKNLDDAKEVIIEGLKQKSTHASSHLILGYINYEQGHKIETILPIYNFLVLESRTPRASQAWEILKSKMTGNVEKETDKKINISLAGLDSEFSGAEMLLSLTQANNLSGSNGDLKTPSDFFIQNTSVLFSYFTETSEDDKKASFYKTYYANFYAKLKNAGHVETFTHFLLLNESNDERAIQWLEQNPEKVDAFVSWFETTKR